MGENSSIEWTDHTFNPWIGCTKVSPGCAHCYAERDMDHRWGKVKWGNGAPRVRTSAANWNKPVQWDAAAKKTGKRSRVFCASLADVFDDEVPIAWLADLFILIQHCRNLDWLLLTKRPQNIRDRMLSAQAHVEGVPEGMPFPDKEPSTVTGQMLNDWEEEPPAHVWLGTTVEDQQRAAERVPALLMVPASVHFLSCEPLLGPVDLTAISLGDDCAACGKPITADAFSASATCECCSEGPEGINWASLDWVIAGGESGPKARPMHPEWARTLRDQCEAAGEVPFLFKQWGEWAPGVATDGNGAHGAFDRMDRFEELEAEAACYVDNCEEGEQAMHRAGKHAAGRELDGRTWDDVPTGVAP